MSLDLLEQPSTCMNLSDLSQAKKNLLLLLCKSFGLIVMHVFNMHLIVFVAMFAEL